MNPDELLEQRIKRVVHHINAIQRLVDTTVVAVLCRGLRRTAQHHCQ